MNKEVIKEKKSSDPFRPPRPFMSLGSFFKGPPTSDCIAVRRMVASKNLTPFRVMLKHHLLQNAKS